MMRASASDSCFLLLVIAAAALALTAGACVPRERDALQAFKKGITGDPAGRLSSWRRGSDCCRWRGVRCSNLTGRVLALRLRATPVPAPCDYGDDESMPPVVHDGDYELCTDIDSTALVGHISPSLLSLEHLEHLDLSLNNLEGANGHLPEFMGSLKSLRYLNLSGVDFSGTLPPQLGNLSNLQYLDLSYTQLSNSADLSWVARLPLLRYLDLTFVGLDMVSDWAHVVNMLPSLRVLHLSCCNLQSANQSLPRLNLTKLERLDLSSNPFNHTAESCWFWRLRSLRYINLDSSTNLYGQVPDELAAMTSLQVFRLSTYNNMVSMEPTLLRNLCNLEILSIGRSLPSGNITEMFESLLQCSSTSKLQKVQLPANNMSGTLPTKMVQLTNLVILDLSENQLTGTLPTKMGQLTNLVILDLSENQLTGTLPACMGQLTSLDILDLSSNQLTGPVPSEIGMLKNVTTLLLDNNNFHGVLMEEHFACLQSLKHIDLSSNHLKIVLDPEWLPPFTLEWAYFHSCQLGPKFPAWLQWSVDIGKLDISDTGITAPFPNWFSTTFSKATYLDISKNRISGGLPTNMEIMSLKRLYLSSNQITGPLTMLPRNLTLLDMSGNYLSGPFPSMSGAPNLEHIYVSSNNLSGHIPGSICELQELMFLNLANNLFEGEFPQCFGMAKMNALVLSNNSFCGMFPSFLHGCTQLGLLDLSQNKFSGRLPIWIGDLMKLQYLRLSNNFFHGNIPLSITNLGQLYNLNLAGNRLSGVIPRRLSNLTAMMMTVFDNALVTDKQWYFYIYAYHLSVVTKRQELYYSLELWDMVNIDLSLNCLTGGIPEEVASLALLKNLNLSLNFLSGKIPDKIGSMSLESLDLSRNKLFGDIPISMSNLTYLSYLDLSYNNLSGRIPSGSQLDSLYANNPYMYSGNDYLCGPPLQDNCMGGNSSKQHDEHDGDQKRITAGHVPDLMFYFHLGLASGFVVGIWVVFCTMLFKKTWRIAYFSLLDKMYEEIHVFVGVTWASL